VEEKVKAKPDTNWYDDLIILCQRTKMLGLVYATDSLRNIGWEQMKGIVHGRVHKHVRDRKLLYDRDLCFKLFQESFFVYCKAVNIWDRSRKTKFLTFLGDILDQELMNIVRMHQYYKSRDKKLEIKLMGQVVDEPIPFFTEEDNEKSKVLEEIKTLLDNFGFESELERDIVDTIIYGRIGDWGKLQRKSNLGAANFSKLRKHVVEKLRNYILANCSEKVKEILQDIVHAK
jgi:hypothetical protein